MTKVGVKFKLSGSYIALVRTTLRSRVRSEVTVLKLRRRKISREACLTDAQPGDQISSSQGEVLPAPPRARLVALHPRPPRAKLPRPVTGIHGLVRDTKGNYDTGYKVEESST